MAAVENNRWHPAMRFAAESARLPVMSLRPAFDSTVVRAASSVTKP